jgi:fructokinase
MSADSLSDNSLLGAVEAGGTKFVCGVGTVDGGSRESVRIDTRDVAATVRDVVAFFEAACRRHGPIEAVGIASFGPVDLNPASPTYGRITTTPKLGWPSADLPKEIGTALRVRTAIDTDVNAAAWAEARVGAARGRGDVAYVTVGTGVGVGLIVNGSRVHGLGHPEAGHLLPRRHPAHEGFAGICPYHGDCLEGLASGPAILAAWNGSLDTLPADHPAWDVEADYLGQLCASLILTLAPEHIVLGGGVMSQHRLFDAVRIEAARRLAGYATCWNEAAVFEARITPPGCVEPPGLLGAYLLADEARRR